jgi:ParB/RepB/Spo0J family partition protein
MNATENVSKSNGTSPAIHTPSRMIAIAQLRESKNNPRKTFDPKKLEELAESIRVDGVLEDLLVRPTGDAHFEIVFGARRYRAAKIAKLEMLPCKVRELSDERALELAIVENSQREDVDPLEEAEGFEMLHVKMKQTVEEIAIKIGKSTAHVYNRLKLCALCDAGRKSYREGKLTSYTAMLIARIPHEDLQKKAIKAIDGSDNWQKEPLSAREAAQVVREKFMLVLEKAPFDRKSLTLYPAAGACGDCPKRTGNHNKLFTDVPSKDLCTDPKCYAVKLEAHNKEKLEALAAKGVSILSKKETAKVFGSTGTHVHSSTGFVNLDDQFSENYGSAAYGKKYRALLKGSELQHHAAISPSGEIVEMVKSGAAAAALKKSGAIKQATGSASSKSEKNRQSDMRKRMAFKKETTSRALVAIAEAATAKARDDKPFWLFLATALIAASGYETTAFVAAQHGKAKTGAGRSHDDVAACRKIARDMSAAELRGLVTQMAACVGSFYGESIGEHVKAAAAVYHVNIDKIAAAVKVEKAPKKASKKVAKIAKPAKKKGRRAERKAVGT